MPTCFCQCVLTTSSLDRGDSKLSNSLFFSVCMLLTIYGQSFVPTWVVFPWELNYREKGSIGGTSQEGVFHCTIFVGSGRTWRALRLSCFWCKNRRNSSIKTYIRGSFVFKTGGTRGNKVSKLTFSRRYGDSIMTMETTLVVMLRIAMFEKKIQETEREELFDKKI